MTLKIGWPHDPEKVTRPWPHEAANWHPDSLLRILTWVGGFPGSPFALSLRGRWGLVVHARECARHHRPEAVPTRRASLLLPRGPLLALGAQPGLGARRGLASAREYRRTEERPRRATG